MPWFGWLMLACVVIGPFDALYLYIKNQKRREEIKKQREEKEQGRPTTASGPPPHCDGEAKLPR